MTSQLPQPGVADTETLVPAPLTPPGASGGLSPTSCGVPGRNRATPAVAPSRTPSPTGRPIGSASPSLRETAPPTPARLPVPAAKRFACSKATFHSIRASDRCFINTGTWPGSAYRRYRCATYTTCYGFPNTGKPGHLIPRRRHRLVVDREATGRSSPPGVTSPAWRSNPGTPWVGAGWGAPAVVDPHRKTSACRPSGHVRRPERHGGIHA
jgi:hypothetical protein